MKIPALLNLSRPAVKFVYSKAKLHWGSTTMRAHQLANLVRPHLAPYGDVLLSSMPSSRLPWMQYLWAQGQKAGSILIFTKYAASTVLPETLAILKKNNCCTCFDYVDSDLNLMRPTGVDIHLAASYAAMDQLIRIQKASHGTNAEIFGQVMLLLHNADERLYRDMAPLPKANQLNMVYLGSRATVFLTPAIERNLTYLDASSDAAMRHSLMALETFNFHYCVRLADEKASGLVSKPFTKGFNAAVLGANLMVHRNTDDAQHFLGPDYPYFIDCTTEAAVIESIALARGSYGSSEWVMALERMADMREKISPWALAQQILFVMKFFDSNVRK
jgi:hypothetical protein